MHQWRPRIKLAHPTFRSVCVSARFMRFDAASIACVRVCLHCCVIDVRPFRFVVFVCCVCWRRPSSKSSMQNDVACVSFIADNTKYIIQFDVLGAPICSVFTLKCKGSVFACCYKTHETHHFPTLSDPFPTPVRAPHLSLILPSVLHWLIRDAQGQHPE